MSRNDPLDVQRIAALDVGRTIAFRIANEAVWHQEQCSFHGATAPNAQGQPARFRSLGGDVYDGTAGIARFLGLAWDVCADDLFRETARGAIEHGLDRSGGWSLFSGRLGVGLVTLELAKRFGDAKLERIGLLAFVDAVADAENAARGGEAPFDLLVGLAGVVVGLVAISDYRDSDHWLQKAIAFAHVIMEHAVAHKTGLSWPIMPGTEEHLCGLAHGASGVAYAFERLASSTGDAQWRFAAARARNYERGFYSTEHGSWADLRAEIIQMGGKQLSYPHMWCHGSIGVGCERIQADPEDLLARADLAAALASAEANISASAQLPVGLSGQDDLNGSQCHGLSAIAELFVDAWQRSTNPRWLALAHQCLGIMQNDARRDEGWRCGIVGGAWTPGLMLGGAGIGWAHFRVALANSIGSCWRFGAK